MSGAGGYSENLQEYEGMPMSLLLFAGALLSFLYFLFLIGYTGAGSSFSYIWLMFAILLMGGWAVRKYLFQIGRASCRDRVLRLV